MNILIINCGSSSQSFKVYQVNDNSNPAVTLSGKARNVATVTREKSRIDYQVDTSVYSLEVGLPTHRQAALLCVQILRQHSIKIDAIGHRFVHGGAILTATTRVTPASVKLLEECLPLAPIHNPNSYSVVQVYQEQMGDVPQFVVFDTAFHANLPRSARLYALPLNLVEEKGFYKYGFHGLSYQYISSKVAALLEKPLERIKLIMCHLGTGGSSVAAFMNGHSLETSMGYSPLPGLVMSTRCGDLDPEIVLELMRQGRSPEEISTLLNTQSGLLGLSGYSSNLAEIIRSAEGGDTRCLDAYEVYASRLQLYIGGYYWKMNGVDAIIFTDDVGTGCWQLREKVCGGVENLGVLLDREKNMSAIPDQAQFIQAAASPVKIISMPTDEESVILQEVMKAI